MTRIPSVTVSKLIFILEGLKMRSDCFQIDAIHVIITIHVDEPDSVLINLCIVRKGTDCFR